jgi:hypothetical protein
VGMPIVGALLLDACSSGQFVASRVAPCWPSRMPAITVFSPGLITRIPQGGSARD